MIYVDDDRVIVEDLGSHNGTYVNGVRLIGKAELADGDQLLLGRTALMRTTSAWTTGSRAEPDEEP
jgi:pSer/pThr/pTyr-binding forkhead associated (FHA) protein